MNKNEAETISNILHSTHFASMPRLLVTFVMLSVLASCREQNSFYLDDDIVIEREQATNRFSLKRNNKLVGNLLTGRDYIQVRLGDLTIPTGSLRVALGEGGLYAEITFLNSEGNIEFHAIYSGLSPDEVEGFAEDGRELEKKGEAYHMFELGEVPP